MVFLPIPQWDITGCIRDIPASAGGFLLSGDLCGPTHFMIHGIMVTGMFPITGHFTIPMPTIPISGITPGTTGPSIGIILITEGRIGIIIREIPGAAIIRAGPIPPAEAGFAQIFRLGVPGPVFTVQALRVCGSGEAEAEKQL